MFYPLYLSFLLLFTNFVSSSFLSAIWMLYNQWSKELVIPKFSSPIVHFCDGLLVYLIQWLNRINNVDFVQNVCLKNCEICMHLILIVTQTFKKIEFFLVVPRNLNGHGVRFHGSWSLFYLWDILLLFRILWMLYNLMVQWSKELIIPKFSSPIVHFCDGLLVRRFSSFLVHNAPTQHLFSYIMAKTSKFSMRWWWGPLCSRPTRCVEFL
jgi:hypothetical protein